jgi:hypothetical protein
MNTEHTQRCTYLRVTRLCISPEGNNPEGQVMLGALQ